MTKTSKLKSPKHRYNFRLLNHYCNEKSSVKGLPSQSTLKLEDKVKTPKNLRELSPRYSLRLKDGLSSKRTTIATFIKKKTSTSNQKLEKKVLQHNISKSNKNSVSSSKKLTLPNESADKFQRNCVSFSENINIKSPKHRYNLRLLNQYCNEKPSDKGLPSQITLKLEDKPKTPKNLRELSPRYSSRLKYGQSSKRTTIATFIQKKTSTSNQKLEKKVLQNNVSKSYKNSLSSSKKLTLPNESADKFQRNCASFSENINIPNDLSMTHKCPKKQKVKSDGFKKFHKSTLKRKKSAIEAVIKADENYEDDLYESKKFDQFRELLMDSPNSERSFSISPPEFPVTPIIRNKTPEFKDCFSPEEYEMSRKAAMEYMYRNQRRGSCPEPPEVLVTAVKKKLEFSQAIENAQKLQTTIERMANKESDDDSDF